MQFLPKILFASLIITMLQGCGLIDALTADEFIFESVISPEPELELGCYVIQDQASCECEGDGCICDESGFVANPSASTAEPLFYCACLTDRDCDCTAENEPCPEYDAAATYFDEEEQRFYGCICLDETSCEVDVDTAYCTTSDLNSCTGSQCYYDETPDCSEITNNSFPPN